jgi:hypothetical protein
MLPSAATLARPLEVGWGEGELPCLEPHTGVLTRTVLYRSRLPAARNRGANALSCRGMGLALECFGRCTRPLKSLPGNTK